MKIDHNDPRRRPFQLVADDLRSKIGEGLEYGPGKALPSIKELSRRYGVAGQTIQSAMRLLKEDGLVVSEPARGLYVRGPGQPESAADSADPADLAAVRSELYELQERVASVEENNGNLQAQIMELYSRMGQPYPHKTSEGAPRREQTS